MSEVVPCYVPLGKLGRRLEIARIDRGEDESVFAHDPTPEGDPRRIIDPDETVGQALVHRSSERAVEVSDEDIRGAVHDGLVEREIPTHQLLATEGERHLVEGGLSLTEIGVGRDTGDGPLLEHDSCVDYIGEIEALQRELHVEQDREGGGRTGEDECASTRALTAAS